MLFCLFRVLSSYEILLNSESHPNRWLFLCPEVLRNARPLCISSSDGYSHKFLHPKLSSSPICLSSNRPKLRWGVLIHRACNWRYLPHKRNHYYTSPFLRAAYLSLTTCPRTHRCLEWRWCVCRCWSNSWTFYRRFILSWETYWWILCYERVLPLMLWSKASWPSSVTSSYRVMAF